MRRRVTVVVAGLALAALAAGSMASCSSNGGSKGSASGTTEPPGHGLKLNQLQVIGTHNSYHIEQPADVLAGYATVEPDAVTLAYTHAPLDQQFENEGVRQIELDVHADPDGSLFRPIGTPGFKVFHIEQIDEKSTCETFTQCLATVKSWSDDHQDAIPIMIHVEIKTGQEFPGPPDSPNMTPALYDALDAEVRAVFPEDRLITPDDVRGGYPTLEAAALAGNWPLIDDVRGRVMFTLDNNRDGYLAGHDSLAGRVAFTPSKPGQPDAAYLQENDPTGPNLARIQDEVRKGYIIRTRADEPVTTPTSGDTTERDNAFVSGAQWVSTDYPIPGLTARFGSTYVAMIPGGTPARCNPIDAPADCQNSWIENSPIPAAPADSSTGTTG